MARTSEMMYMAHKKNTKAKARQAKAAAPAAKKPAKRAADTKRPAAVRAASKATKKPTAGKSAPNAKAAPVIKSAKKPAPAAKPAPGKASAAKAGPAKASPSPAAKVAPVKAAAAKVAPAKPAAAKTAPAAKPVAAKPVASSQPAAGARPVAAKLGQVKAPVPVASAVQPARAVPAAVARPAGQRISQPVPPAALPMAAKAATEKAAAARDLTAQSKKPVNQRHGFKTNEFIVYPAHGVGRIVGIEEQEIAGMALELFVITFDKEKLTLRVPTGKLASVGMRKLADEDIVKKAMDILKGRARIKRTMWSRRAQEYVAKINSGDLVSIAEVVRDLYRSEAQPEQSYSERQLYEDALDRMAREIAAVDKLDERGAVQRITEVLAKSAKGRRLAAEEAEAEADAEAEAEVKAA
ncbi:MAG: CarD family transcriptional regulator [Pseudomonadota bacterium]